MSFNWRRKICLELHIYIASPHYTKSTIAGTKRRLPTASAKALNRLLWRNSQHRIYIVRVSVENILTSPFCAIEFDFTASIFFTTHIDVASFYYCCSFPASTSKQSCTQHTYVWCLSLFTMLWQHTSHKVTKHQILKRQQKSIFSIWMRMYIIL